MIVSGTCRQSVGSNVRGRGVVESQTGGSLHRSASEHPGGGRQWSDVTRRPGNGQYWKLSSSRGRSNDWRRLEQDTSSSGKLLVIIRGLPGSGKTTLARYVTGQLPNCMFASVYIVYLCLQATGRI